MSPPSSHCYDETTTSSVTSMVVTTTTPPTTAAHPSPASLSGDCGLETAAADEASKNRSDFDSVLAAYQDRRTRHLRDLNDFALLLSRDSNDTVTTAAEAAVPRSRRRSRHSRGSSQLQGLADKDATTVIGDTFTHHHWNPSMANAIHSNDTNLRMMIRGGTGGYVSRNKNTTTESSISSLPDDSDDDNDETLSDGVGPLQPPPRREYHPDDVYFQSCADLGTLVDFATELVRA